MSSRNIQPVDRYPGLRSFEQGENLLFEGRDREINDLLDLIRAEQMIVLFAKSGLGKSSLLNAGISPLLVKLGYWPIRVRFQMLMTTSAKDSDGTVAVGPLDIVRQRLNEEFSMAYVTAQSPRPYVSGAKIDRLWEDIKVRPFPDGAAPIFIFDQFEEFFSYSKPLREAFLIAIAELMHDRPPTRISDRLLQIHIKDRKPEQMEWCRQPLVKCLFAIRSDRLFEIDSLRAYIPLILRNRYQLNPLDRIAAQRAIEIPGGKRMPFVPNYFSSPPFTYSAKLLDLILNKLSDRNGVIEGAQLQMICSYIEESVKKRSDMYSSLSGFNSQNGKMLEVDNQIIANEAAIDRIISQFYKTQLQQLGPEYDIDKIGRIIETEFIESGQRVGCPAVRLRSELGSDHEIIVRRLQELRLIRPEITTVGLTYELSHDTLVKPVEDARQHRLAQEEIANAKKIADEALETYKQREKRIFRRTGFIAIAVLLISVIVGYYTIYLGHLKDRIINYAAAQQFDLGRHYKAYRLWQKSENPNTIDKTFLPFSGTDLETDAYRAIVAIKYNDGLEVFRTGSTDSIYRQNMPIVQKMNVNDHFEVGGTSLVTYNDSTFAVFKFEQNTDIPFSPSIPFRSFNRRSILPDNKMFKLSPTGKFIMLQVGTRKIVLYRFDKQKITELDKFAMVLDSTTKLFNFNRVSFSSDEKWVYLKDAISNKLFLFSIAGNISLPVIDNIKVARFSASGKRLALVDFKGGVWLLDLNSKEIITRKIFDLKALHDVPYMTFIRNDSSLLIVSNVSNKKGLAGQLNRLDLLDLNLGSGKKQTVLSPRKLNHRAGQSFFHVLDALGNWKLYNPITNSIQSTIFRDINDSQIKDSWQQLRLDVDRQNNLVIYDLIKQIRYKPKLTMTRSKILNARFCYVRQQAMPTLAVLYSDSLQVIDLADFPKLRYYKPIKGTFLNMTTIGDLIQLESKNGFKSLIFADGKKNQLSYLQSYIYPDLSEPDMDELQIDSWFFKF